jgi:putative hydrolase of HD superfamily
VTPPNRAWVEDLLNLKRTPRTGWFRVGVDRPESVADHSFSAALLAWRLARDGGGGLDAGKVLLMALLHDFHEAQMTDIPTPAKKHFPPEAIAGTEAAVIREQWGDDPASRELLRELEQGESAEAKLVWAVDHLEFLLQAIRYRRAGYRDTAPMFVRMKDGPAWTHPITRPVLEDYLADLSDDPETP